MKFSNNIKYQIIYMDPPWQETGGGKIVRGCQRHYPVMSIEEIMKLPIEELADENCHLYMWITNTFLPCGFDLLKHWNFKYITLITWAKDKFGLGQYYRGQTEHIMFARKGNLPYKKELSGKRCQGSTLFHAKRTEHSKKPEYARQMIEHVSDRKGYNKIELFARTMKKGWDNWGNHFGEIKIRTEKDMKKDLNDIF